ncbi:halocyanin domain-containing protein [Natrononativus amylolyticus]|uniref:halocyanin domain-containing protein n=1 Tax=Natrononativus amylolyticus TaxID=2963434 RepID=UPI0020CCCE71|nr:halocyanin domain-containing protein [Natrononativus amylolyticus]
MDANTQPRRAVLVGVAAGALGTLAGCLGDDDEDSYYEGEEFVDDEPEYDGTLESVDHPGTVDWTGEDEVTVAVGTGREGMGFAPRAIRIDAGTTVVWEWTGDGGRHDVVDTDGAFDSGQSAAEGHTFEYAFDEPGTYTYVCVPHEHRGMVGGVDVR